MKKSIKKTTIASKVNETLKAFRGNVKQSLHELFKHGTTCTGSSGYSKGYASKSIWTKETISVCQNLGLSVHSGNSAPRGGACGEWVKLIEDKRKNKLAQQYRAIYVRALKVWEIRRKKTALKQEQLHEMHVLQTKTMFESKNLEIVEEIKKQYPSLDFSHKESNSIAWHIGNKLMGGKFHQTTLRTLIKDVRQWRVLDIEKLYRLMNHDSSHEKPRYEVYTLDELNKQFETDYTSIDEAIDAEPEYLYREEEIKEHLRD